MSTQDQYLLTQVGSLLAPGEQVLFVALMRKAPGLWLQVLLLGAILQLLGGLMTKPYFVALTNRRIILLRTTTLVGEEWDVRTVLSVQVGGVANNRSMTFFFTNAPKRTLRISPMRSAVAGTAEFFARVPDLLNSGALGNAALGGLVRR